MSQIRVLVVDDSVVVRKLVADSLAEDPDIEVVGTAANGKIALAKAAALKPDLITLDIEMPVMDGLETLPHLRKEHPRVPVIMFSTLTERGASATLTALERGARDYVTKPANVGSIAESKEAVKAQLVPKIHALCRRTSAPRAATVRRVSGPVALRSEPTRRRVDLVVIGSSTGGPDALATVLSGLPANFPVPVLVTQHIPPIFSRQLAERLDTKCQVSVAEAVEGDRVLPGRVLIAPGDWHLRVAGRPHAPTVTLDQGDKENFCRPAVDVLFRSAAKVFGGHVLSVVLTGMGADGALGSVAIAEAGGQVIAQDEQSSVVWGMPGAVAAAGTANQILPLSQVASAIVTRCAAQRGPASGTATTSTATVREGARA